MRRGVVKGGVKGEEEALKQATKRKQEEEL